jgi:hypothetical protein
LVGWLKVGGTANLQNQVQHWIKRGRLVGWLFFASLLLTGHSVRFHMNSSQPTNQPTFMGSSTAPEWI